LKRLREKIARWMHQERFILAHPVNRGKPIRATLRFLAWVAWTRAIRRPLTIRFWDNLRLLAHADDRIAKLAVYTKLPDYDDMLFTLRYLRSTDTFVDVGANVGIYSLLASRAVAEGQVLAFEPNPIAAERMRQNLRLNKLDNVVLQTAAVGTRAGSAALTATLGTADHIAAGEPSEINTISVSMTTLDVAVMGASPVSLVKIDVEGFEVEVLRGASDLLTRDDAPVWIMEVNGLSERYGAGDAMIEDIFRRHGYGMYLYDADTNRLLEAATPAFQAAYEDRSRWIIEVGINVIFIRDLGKAVARLVGAVDVEARRGR
jgi:FkbM family methyltransferase